MVQTVLTAEKTGESNVDVARPWIGASGQAVTADIADSIGLKLPKGVLINKLHSQSPAKKAGMSIGDVVISINGREIDDPAEMKFRLATVPLGDSADMTVLREGKEKVFSVLAMAPPDKPDRDETTLTGNHPLNGAIIGRINPRVAVELNMNNEDREGVVVMGFTDRAPAGRIAAVGDIIVALNGEEISDIKDLSRELDQAIRRGTFDLVTERNGRRNQIVIR